VQTMKAVLLAVGIFLVTFTLADVALAQTRAITETPSSEWASFVCTKSADGTVECSGCVLILIDDGQGAPDTRHECAPSFTLNSTVNKNRADGLGNAVRNRALKRFGVDGGAP